MAEEEGAVAAVVALIAEDRKVAGEGGFEGLSVAGLKVAGSGAVRRRGLPCVDLRGDVDALDGGDGLRLSAECALDAVGAEPPLGVDAIGGQAAL